MVTGEWADPQRAKVSLQVYAGTWIDRSPNLRPGPSS
jgi:hypothetical protein